MIAARNFTAILTTLRCLMVSNNLSAYIVPSGDAHYTEFIADCHQRRAYISGFTGSAGTAIVTVNNTITPESALLWTDGRYYLQAENQLPNFWTLMKEGQPGVPSQATWLKESLPNGSVVGVDPTLYSKQQWDGMKKELDSVGVILQGLNTNLVDQDWTDRPSCGSNPVFNQEMEFSGKSSKDKVADVRNEMKENGATVLVVTELDEVAWFLNLRGSDIPYSATFFAYVIVTDDQFHVFIDGSQLRETETATLKTNIPEIQINNYDSILDKLKEIVTTTSGKVWYTPNTNYALVKVIEELRTDESQQVVKASPIALMKAIKNPIEVAGFKKALIRDSAAICSFLAWLETEIKEATVTEISAAEKLHSIRMEQDNFVDDSFPTISATGDHGAIIHYMPTVDTNQELNSTADMFLLDSGGLYRDGTTDITRTIHLGVPTPHQKDCYTRVLKGHFALARAIFPNKVVGSRLDSFARQFLWEAGLDYNHGTGHGVGSFLNIHEGPFGIGSGYRSTDPGLQENFFTSNEPGYYEDNAFGIRLENVIRVQNVTLDNNFQNRGYLGFEDLTFVPYHHNLIDFSLLTDDELEYLNDYQNKVRDLVGSYMQEKNMGTEAYEWMIRATVPVNKDGPVTATPPEDPNDSAGVRMQLDVFLCIIPILVFTKRIICIV